MSLVVPHTSASLPAFSRAISTLLTRLGWPLPIPSSRWSFATAMALLFTCFTQSQAKRRSASCASLGCSFDTGLYSMSAGVRESACCHSQPPVTVQSQFRIMLQPAEVSALVYLCWHEGASASCHCQSLIHHQKMLLPTATAKLLHSEFTTACQMPIGLYL